ncbi:MAG: lasso peptide biosynthesis B2 protein, partial [Gammaproteobacteria bacterium]
MRKLRTFLALPGAQRRAFLEALAWVWASLLALRVLGLSRALRLWPDLPPARSNAATPEAALWIRAAARNAPGADTCLVRSLALTGVLRRHGVPAELRIGVGNTQPQLDAHAWVEVRGVP